MLHEAIVELEAEQTAVGLVNRMKDRGAALVSTQTLVRCDYCAAVVPGSHMQHVEDLRGHCDAPAS